MRVGVGDYEVTVDWAITRPVVAWAYVGDPGAPPTVLLPPNAYSNTFTIHVVN